MSTEDSILFGSRNGGKSFHQQCPAGEVITGLHFKWDDHIQSLTEMECANPQKLYTGERSLITFPSHGGGQQWASTVCPPGTVLSDISGVWKDGDQINEMSFRCYDFAKKKSIALDTHPGDVTLANSAPQLGISIPGKTYINGDLYNAAYANGIFTGVSGSYFSDSVGQDSLTFQKANKEANDKFFLAMTDEGKRKFCMSGEKGYINMDPGACDNFARNYCLTHPDDPFCSCFNSKVMANAKAQDPNFPYCPEVFDQQCQLYGYKYQALKDHKGSDCTYLNCGINALKNTFGTGASIVQNCSFNEKKTTNKIDGGGASSTSVPIDRPIVPVTTNPVPVPVAQNKSASDPVADSSIFGLDQNTFLLLLLFLLLGLAYFFMSGSSDESDPNSGQKNKGKNV